MITPVSDTLYDNDAIRAQAADPANEGLISQAKASHIDEQAENGRLIDSRKVFGVALGEARIIWEVGSSITSFHERSVNVTDSPGAEPSQVDMAASESEEYEYPWDDVDIGTEGAGMGAYSAATGSGKLLTYYCQTWTSKGSELTSCAQKFKPTSDGSSVRDYYAYNRWGSALGKNVRLGTDYYPVVIDFRSRPRKGYEGRTLGLVDYFPQNATQLCNEGPSANLSVGSLGFTIPLSNCEEKVPMVNATTKTMGVRFDQGFVFGGPRQRGIDFEMEVAAHQGGAVPLLGDYNYAKFCKDTLANCHAVSGIDGW